MESHLEQLVEAASHSGESSPAATATAQRQFGDAVKHFQDGLRVLERRQQALRRLMISLTVVSGVVTAVGVLAVALLVREARDHLADLVAADRSAEPLVGMLHTDGLVLSLESTVAGERASSEIPVSQVAWDSLVSSLGISCPGDLFPVMVVDGTGEDWRMFGLNPESAVTVAVLRRHRIEWAPQVGRDVAWEVQLRRAIDAAAQRPGGVRKVDCRPIVGRLSQSAP